MLRFMFGEPPRQNEGIMLAATEAMGRVMKLFSERMDQSDDPDHTWRKFEIWTRGIAVSLDELEESKYASERFGERVQKAYQDDMSKQEEADYYRHIYFYKNGFIRVFSILDKLGTLLNGVFDLHTERAKAHFSFFTVLRQFNYLKVHSGLADRLGDIKLSYKDPLSRLRKMRNTETHYMNTEMQDDLYQRHQTLHVKVKLEDLQHNLADLQCGFQMVCETLKASFDYMLKELRRDSKGTLRKFSE